MKLRIVWLLGIILLFHVACKNSANSTGTEAKSPDNVMLSELHGMNHTIRNFQDLLKRKPGAEAYTAYADFLERRLKVIHDEFADELESNAAAKVFAEAVEKAVPELRNSDAEKRNLAQLKLNDANENAARDLKLN